MQGTECSYVDKPTADSDVAEATTEKKRPVGRAPVGNVFDSVEGVYVAPSGKTQKSDEPICHD